jgi:Sulfotransferase family
MRSDSRSELIERPIVIVAAPRSGSTLLFSILSTHPALWSLYTESNSIIEGPFHPSSRGSDSNALDARDLDAGSRDALVRAFYRRAGNIERVPLGRHLPIRGRGTPRMARMLAFVSSPWKRPPIRLVEKSPKNTLRVPFMRELFPDARFLHLTRDPRSNIASLIRGWRSDRHKTYPLPDGFSIEGYASDRWSFVLQPGWRSLDGRSLADVCADQWLACNRACVDHLDASDLRIRYEDLIGQPEPTLDSVATWADIDPDPFGRYEQDLPVVQTRTRPDADKWLALRDEVEGSLPLVRDLAQRLGYD